MTAAHLHLLVNHLPIFAAAFAIPILLGALWARSRGAWSSGVLLLVVGAIGSVVATQSGERSEDAVEEIPGVTEAAIHDHEEAAEAAMAISILTALGAAAAWWLARTDRWQRPAMGATTIAAAATFGMMALAGSSGGRIRHAAEIDGVTGGGSTATEAGARPGHGGEEDDD